MDIGSHYQTVTLILQLRTIVVVPSIETSKQWHQRHAHGKRPLSFDRRTDCCCFSTACTPTTIGSSSAATTPCHRGVNVMSQDCKSGSSNLFGSMNAKAQTPAPQDKAVNAARSCTQRREHCRCSTIFWCKVSCCVSCQPSRFIGDRRMPGHIPCA